jgi:RHS repeat-associated protein
MNSQSSGMTRTCVYGTLVGKFTSKERDAETGLDFFGARYMSSAQGRFTSADPFLNSAKLWDPQTWNRYSYALNNPLKIVDPNGLYNLVNNCDEDNKKCNKEFEQNAKNLKQGIADLQKQVDKMKDGAEKNGLQAALYAIGTENDYNNVNVSFGPTGDGAAALTSPTYNGQTNSLDYNITFDPKRTSFGGTTNGWAIDAAHEGTHVADISDPRYSNQSTTLSPFSLEYRGYQTSSWAASALGMPSLALGNGRYEIWNRSWGLVDKTLTNFLTNMKDSQGRQNHPETTPHNPWGN